MPRNRDESGRRTKGAIVTKMSDDKTGRSGVVKLDKDDMMFWAVAGSAEEGSDAESTSYFESAKGSEVESWLRKEIRKPTRRTLLDWKPVIQVEITSGSARHYYGDSDEETEAGVRVQIKRYWIAETLDHREWRSLKWEQCDPDSTGCLDERDRFGQSRHIGKGKAHEDFKPENRKSYGYSEKPFVMPQFASKKDDEGTSTLWYTEELWLGLTQVVAQISAAKETLHALLATKGGLDMVTQIGAGKMPLRITATAGE